MDNAFKFTYAGHATCIIESAGMRVITDIHIGNSVMTQKRHGETISPKDVQNIDAIIISHEHIDHLHAASLKYVSCDVPIFVPVGSRNAVGRFMPNPVIELSEYASHTLENGTEITAVPTRHPAWRFLPPRRVNALSYLIRFPNCVQSIFFCGDSAYGEHFKEIGDIAEIHTALLPIGGYSPRFLRGRTHMTPDEAVQAFKDLNAKHMIPIHYGTFRLSFETVNAPLKRLQSIMTKEVDLADAIHPLSTGKSVFWKYDT